MKRTFNFKGNPVTLSKSEYLTDGTLAVLMERENGEDDVITVNLRSPFESDTMAFLDENNHPGIGQWMCDNQLAIPMGVTIRSGFCQYWLYTILTDNFND